MGSPGRQRPKMLARLYLVLCRLRRNVDADAELDAALGQKASAGRRARTKTRWRAISARPSPYGARHQRPRLMVLLVRTGKGLRVKP